MQLKTLVNSGRLRKIAKKMLPRLAAGLLLALFTASCATGGYFIPPNSGQTPATPTVAADISFLFNTPLPPADPPQEAAAEPAPTQPDG